MEWNLDFSRMKEMTIFLFIAYVLLFVRQGNLTTINYYLDCHTIAHKN